MRLFLLATSFFITINASAQNDSLTSNIPIDSGYFSSFDGTKIYYEVRGSGKPVLLIHGFIVSGNSWTKTALYNNLVKQGYKVIFPDLRGNGKSGKPHDPTAYEQDAEAKDIMQLVDLLKLDSYSVVGYSRGSIISARLLVLDKRVSTAVLGGMGADFTNPEWPRRKMFYRALMGDSVPELKEAVAYVKSAGLDQLALAYLQKAQPSTSKEQLGTIRQPVLVISGDKDSDNGSASQLAKLLPNSTLASIPGDHNHASATTEFSVEVTRFLMANNY